MRIALGIASTAHEVGEVRWGTQHVRLDLWHDDLETGGGTKQSQHTSILHQAVDDRCGTYRQRVEHLDEDMHRDVKGGDVGLHGDMQLQRMQQLCQNEGNPQLDQDQFGACPPPNVQTQFAFEQLERQFNVPAPCVQLHNVMQRQVRGTQHVGQVAILDPMVGEADQLGRRDTCPTRREHRANPCDHHRPAPP